MRPNPTPPSADLSAAVTADLFTEPCDVQNFALPRTVAASCSHGFCRQRLRRSCYALRANKTLRFDNVRTALPTGRLPGLRHQRLCRGLHDGSGHRC